MSRQKTYSAQNGYVYQYQFSGQTSAPAETRYEFTVWSQGAMAADVTVVLETAVAAGWETANSFRLTETQRYALAKMAFFQALDEATGPGPPVKRISIGAAGLTVIAQTLDLI